MTKVKENITAIHEELELLGYKVETYTTGKLDVWVGAGGVGADLEVSRDSDVRACFEKG